MMAKLKYSFIAFLVACSFCNAQEFDVVDTMFFDKNEQRIFVGGFLFNQWRFHPGNNPKWAEKEIDTTGWVKLSPTSFSAKYADANGRAEGWFRWKFKIDSSFENFPISLQLTRWLAKDVYIEGKLIASIGNTGSVGGFYTEPTSTMNLSAVPLNLKPGVVYDMAVHVVDYTAPLNPWKLKSELNASFGVYFIGPDSQARLTNIVRDLSVYFSIYTAVCATLCMLFWLLYLQNRQERILSLIAIGMTMIFLEMFCISVHSFGSKISFTVWNVAKYAADAGFGIIFYIFIYLTAAVFKRPVKASIALLTAVIGLFPLFTIYFSFLQVYYVGLLYQLLIISVFGYLVGSSWKQLKGAQWAVVVGLVAVILFGIVYTFQASKHPFEWPFPYCYELLGGVFLSFPFSLMVYVGMRFKEVLKEVQLNAKEVLSLSEEKKEQAIRQQIVLEQEVARQTIELRTSFENLTSTQAQLIQSEKMASLGELTAGIAHEIQNPLNFVNNFSEVSNELISEMVEEVDRGNAKEVKEIARDVQQNLEKILHHGKRADAIVKGMLQHSRSSSGQKEATDINALCDEYLRLAYHGLRAKDNSFNASFQTEFDPNIGNISIVPQDIGRVLFNLINNAFYAVSEKAKTALAAYEPVVTVTTKKLGSQIEISVSDNGNGIPDNIREKIFQPFFTTKPTGQGTGLGLSLSYDIVKAHGGELKVETKEGEGTTFIIQLPAV